MFRLKRGFWNLPGTPSIDLIKIFCLILRVCCFIFSITNWYMMCCLSGNQQYPDKSWRFCISETVRKFSISTCELHACRLREGLGGFVPLHRPIVHRFQLKILLYCNFMCSPVVCIEQKYAQCSWIYGANKKKKHAHRLLKWRAKFESLKFLPLYDCLEFLCVCMTILEFSSPESSTFLVSPPTPTVRIFRFVPPPDSSHATSMTDWTISVCCGIMSAVWREPSISECLHCSLLCKSR